MRVCPKCNEYVPGAFCPECGTTTVESSPSREQKTVWTLGNVLAAILCIFASLFMVYGKFFKLPFFNWWESLSSFAFDNDFAIRITTTIGYSRSLTSAVLCAKIIIFILYCVVIYALLSLFIKSERFQRSVRWIYCAAFIIDVASIIVTVVILNSDFREVVVWLNQGVLNFEYQVFNLKCLFVVIPALGAIVLAFSSKLLSDRLYSRDGGAAPENKWYCENCYTWNSTSEIYCPKCGKSRTETSEPAHTGAPTYPKAPPYSGAPTHDGSGLKIHILSGAGPSTDSGGREDHASSGAEGLYRPPEDN